MSRLAHYSLLLWLLAILFVTAIVFPKNIDCFIRESDLLVTTSMIALQPFSVSIMLLLNCQLGL